MNITWLGGRHFSVELDADDVNATNNPGEIGDLIREAMTKAVVEPMLRSPLALKLEGQFEGKSIFVRRNIKLGGEL